MYESLFRSVRAAAEAAAETSRTLESAVERVSENDKRRPAFPKAAG